MAWAATDRLAGNLAVIGFVHFHYAAILTEQRTIITGHRQPNAVSHEPCGIQLNPQCPVQLVRAHAFLGTGNQDDRLQPHMHLDVARFKDGPDLHGEWLAAVVALPDAYPGGLALQLAGVADHAALGADRAFRPETGLDESVSGCFVVEVRGGEN